MICHPFGNKPSFHQRLIILDKSAQIKLHYKFSQFHFDTLNVTEICVWYLHIVITVLADVLICDSAIQ